MNRPRFLGFMGGPKTGKSHLLATLFTSGEINPERVLYLDNHGSTSAMNLPQWSKTEPWGVRHVPTPADMIAALKEARSRQGQYDALAVDGWSQYSQDDIDAKMEKATDGQKMKVWGAHGDLMRLSMRICQGMVIADTHVLVTFEAAQLPDPLVEKPKKIKDGELTYSADPRPTRLRPFLQGAFARELPYKLDALFYSHVRDEGVKGYQFLLQLAPDKKVEVLTRWLAQWVADPRKSKDMENPTWDKVIAFINEQTEE